MSLLFALQFWLSWSPPGPVPRQIEVAQGKTHPELGMFNLVPIRSKLGRLPDGTLGLNFGGSRDLSEITKDQIRRFADTARIPVSPLWEIVIDTAERTLENWKTLEHRDALPKGIRAAVEKQIFKVAATTK